MRTINDKQAGIILALNAARARIVEALEHLDEYEWKCGGCGCRRYRSFADHQAAETLRGAATRIGRVIEEADHRLIANDVEG